MPANWSWAEPKRWGLLARGQGETVFNVLHRRISGDYIIEIPRRGITHQAGITESLSALAPDTV